ncbi:hypothetical protein C0J50_16770, partial [Silurus asotus]
VTLSCKYKPSSSASDYYLHWYKQHPKSKPEFLLYIYDATGQKSSFADKIWPTDNNILRKESETVTLKCSYETNSDNIYLNWYKQYPNSTPQFLLYKGARSRSDRNSTPDDHRLETETTSDSTELTIGGLKLSDSALYHCALE